MSQNNQKLAIIWLGCVGLPLAVEFGNHCSVAGFDIDAKRLAELRSGTDHTLEVDASELKAVRYLAYTTQPDELRHFNVFIVTLPTPIDAHQQTDLPLLVKGSETNGKVPKKGDVVVYESTVYLGVTEEVCVPALERHSGRVFNQVFYASYSPERVMRIFWAPGQICWWMRLNGADAIIFKGNV